MAMPAPGRNVDRIPGLPRVAHAVDLAPARSLDDEELRVPGVAGGGGVGGGGGFVGQRGEGKGRGGGGGSHVDAGAHAARRRRERDVVLPDHAAAVLAPVLDELGAALFLDVIVRDRGGGLGRHEKRVFRYMEPCSRGGTSS